ncbi:hypothetical protein J5N97_013529 [Dioscorea zingiberensis]|uniref:BZIP domain-containing protein n=1 Tax=Dioscorea zingiberensis TaxID=325984 RepID=A0A9D5HIW9_9LILI|nr:hypothetical protein J5N97_013523 [Dioscorea zingiberensis]KAJ0978055.1 hypothetical protein J5N97_013529 [Dioscorea zingiberensis]
MNKGNGMQPSLGEMTLEDFLMDAQQDQWLQRCHQMIAIQQQQNTSPILDATYAHGKVNMPKTQARGNKRAVGTEKTVERRQKRMIKNRESAARSRARKQAYTNELENKISLLEEENEKLKKQKALDAIVHCAPILEPKHWLRRTSSAPL